MHATDRVQDLVGGDDERTSTPRPRASPARSATSSSFCPRMTTALMRTGASPASMAAATARSTVPTSVAERVRRANRSGRSVSSETVSRVSPARRHSRIISTSAIHPLVVIATSAAPARDTPSTIRVSPERSVGSPPVSRTFVTPSPTQTRATRTSSSSRRSWSLGRKRTSGSMQYVHRNPHRSVIDSRRSRIVRPWASTSGPALPAPAGRGGARRDDCSRMVSATPTRRA
jgi:hypothetical protein